MNRVKSFMGCLVASTNNEAEIRALEVGLRLYVRQGISRIMIEGDSQIIIKGISRPSFHNWKLNTWVPMIKEHLRRIWSYEIGHVYREGNQVADYLANLGVGEYDVPVYFFQTSAIEDIKGQCLKDCRRYPR
ncbi:uncharacterized protein LOC131875700 [Cryptomeria japonica]|uniref:uncharacterized protein LOC131875700 n=1 Tax=Cryptomeria japonica TaxID=3369 RepID=UPI0027D9F41A|nr:uncharacterized protein LOC131875700 [Cryptomeria japonica]